MLIWNKFRSFSKWGDSNKTKPIPIVLQGERDYSKLVGDTGPCVYPAGHIYSYVILRKITEGDVFSAQIVFTLIYLVTQSIVMAVYVRSTRVPAWAFALLCLSKRMHSIYILRLFNDCIAMLLAYSAILCLVRSRPRLSVALFSLAVSVKMNVLLMAPPVLIVMLQSTNVFVMVQSVGIGVLIQVGLALPFLLHHPMSYIAGAFDLSRVFLFEWTVNLKFLPEEIFVSKKLALFLLALHLLLLLVYAHYVWCRRTGGLFGTIGGFLVRKECRLEQIDRDHILFVLFSGNLIGVICARSLHYQFYSWYFHSIPFLLWSVDYIPPPFKLALWVVIEVVWNVFPSNSISSLCLLVAHIALLDLTKIACVRDEARRKKAV